MAITVARDEEDFKKKVKHGSSGGLAPEGHDMSMYVHGSDSFGEEGVVTRGAEGDAKRFAEAEKFQKSKIAVAKMTPKDWEKLAEKKEKEADEKPTAKDAKVEVLEAGHGQPAKTTEKQEKADLEEAKKKENK